MKLELKYFPEDTEIDVAKDVMECLKQLGECYNEVLQNKQNEIDGLNLERKSVIKALKDNNIESLKNYFGI